MSDSLPTLKVEKRGFAISLPIQDIADERRGIWAEIQQATQLSIMAATVGLTRREASRTTIEPTPEEIAEHKRIEALFAEVSASPWWEDGYESGYVRDLEPRVEIEWAETVDEFRARVEQAYAAMRKDPAAFLGIPEAFRGEGGQ